MRTALPLVLVLGAAVAVGAGGPTQPAGNPALGPVAPGTPPCAWGSVVHDPVNAEHVWFGGTGGRSRTGGLATWVLKDGVWSERTFGTDEVASPGDPGGRPVPPYGVSYGVEWDLKRGLLWTVGERGGCSRCASTVLPRASNPLGSSVI